MDSMLRTDLGHGLTFDSAQAVQKARLAGQNLSKRFGKSDSFSFFPTERGADEFTKQEKHLHAFSNKRRVDIVLESMEEWTKEAMLILNTAIE